MKPMLRIQKTRFKAKRLVVGGDNKIAIDSCCELQQQVVGKYLRFRSSRTHV